LTLKETIEGKAFLKVFGQCLISKGQLYLVASHKLNDFIPGIIKTGSAKDTMDGFHNLILPLLGYSCHYISNTMNSTALPGNPWPDIICRFEQPRVTIGN